ncbi:MULTISPECIES: glycoside hydrolase family protein [Shewanella]|uniref:glycoside hydrolase family protein n=1 Tax=Shewanella TaxID=22 RepID=UPI001FB99583|nr:MULTISPECIES: lysozyme [Shewanella]
MMTNRIKVASLSLSAAALITLVVSEGFSPSATIPVQGDRPTVGFGSTYHANGKPVKLGDKLTPVQALKTTQAHVANDEVRFKESLPGVEMTQGEYDLYINWVYQYGIGRWRESAMRSYLLKGRHLEACNALLLPEYRTVGGFDCSTPGNKRCMGVWTRAQERHQLCIQEQSHD